MIKNSSNLFQCYYWFSERKEEELFSIISVMIKSKIEELLPQMVEDLLRQKMDNISLNV